MKSATLFIFSGLPATGKTTLAKRLAAHMGAVYLRIDTVEQGLRDLCNVKVQGEGYRLSYRVAADNLNIGNSVVADSCNPIDLTRTEWEQVARDAHAPFINIEIICSDRAEHRRRILSRTSDIPGLEHPDWEAVQNREYHGWTRDRILIDTAGSTKQDRFENLISQINGMPPVSNVLG